MNVKYVYAFDETDASMKELLGGKGANLGEMTKMGLPVPPGFTITTDACRYVSKHGKLPGELEDQLKAAMAKLEKQMGKSFGAKDSPLLVSVRSGAAISMPGMMDTVLNLGLTKEGVTGLALAAKDERFAWDANRRFLTMFGDVVQKLDRKDFDLLFDAEKTQSGARFDHELSVDALKRINRSFYSLIAEKTGSPFPDDPWQQLEMAIMAVFSSWDNERAVAYRKRAGISHDLGTAVNVQAMVFGNLGDNCGTGVAFTRDPSSGKREIYGEYLKNAQGEDVVAGIRTPHPIAHLEKDEPEVYKVFLETCNKLETHYLDMMDIEFTIERGTFYMLQCRSGKRTGPAAVQIAVDMANEGLITQDEAILRVQPEHLDQLLHPRIDQKDALRHKAVASGLPASPGAGLGQIVLSSQEAIRKSELGLPVILVREETSPEDVPGMLISQGILTARGGKTSHAAVVARGFGIPCVSGIDSLRIDHELGSLSFGQETFQEGDWLTIDGTSGEVFRDQLRLVPAQVSGAFGELMAWCDQRKTLLVRANADNAKDAENAISFGAVGIGLCRTEHMFFEADRLPIVRNMILANHEEERQAALLKLESVQTLDFEQLFSTLRGRPITIRLLDPPLHEFLPHYDDVLNEVTELKLAVKSLQGQALARLLEEKTTLLNALIKMKESNPMLGLRGVRLSLVFNGLIAMQTRAILRAAHRVQKRGIDVHPEIMIPLVSHKNELKLVKDRLEKVAKTFLEEEGAEVDYLFGTMIELPRAALTAGEIAESADFFSFGTNDLTQMTWGISRDDAEEKFLKHYVKEGILESNPFESLDQVGVGRLLRFAVEEGREKKPGLKVGICGEHGGEPKSIAFCHSLGLDYVSCSPFRVPIARLAAAQAALQEAKEKG